MTSAPAGSSAPPRYGGPIPAPQASSSSAATQFFSRATTATRAHFNTRRPWPELFALSSITRPYTFGEATLRIKRNLSYFRVNYTMIVLFVLFVSLLWHPISMIIYLVVFVGWFFLYFFRDQPLEVLGRTVDDRVVLGVLGVVTIVALVLTHVWLNVLVSLLIGGLLVVVHAAFRGVDDLYGEINESDGGGMFSVVGSPITRTGYNGF